MRIPTVFFAAAALSLCLSACMEAQSAPNLDRRGSSTFIIDVVNETLSTPWSVAVLPDGGYLVTEKMGHLKYVKSGQSAIEIPGLPADIYTDQQAGLFDVVLAPDFESSGNLYLSYAYGDAKNNGTAVISAHYDGKALSAQKTIFKAAPSKDTGAHFGGRIVVMPDATLIITLGDGFAHREEAQKLSSDLGTIVRINPDGSIPDDNPFQGVGNARPEIYSYGHRNVQGAVYDAVTQRLWAHEHGPRGGDELNLIEPGANYGWPIATTGVD